MFIALIDYLISGQAGDGLLAIAAWHDKPDIVRILLREFKVDVNSKNYSKATPLHRASSSGSIRCATLLLEKGADTEACDATGRTPVDVGVTESIRELIKVGICALIVHLEIKATLIQLFGYTKFNLHCLSAFNISFS